MIVERSGRDSQCRVQSGPVFPRRKSREETLSFFSGFFFRVSFFLFFSFLGRSLWSMSASHRSHRSHCLLTYSLTLALLTRSLAHSLTSACTHFFCMQLRTLSRALSRSRARSFSGFSGLVLCKLAGRQAGGDRLSGQDRAGQNEIG